MSKTTDPEAGDGFRNHVLSKFAVGDKEVKRSLIVEAEAALASADNPKFDSTM